jgi:prepilin-type N-terminal cleavage/methylation domain-containing protein
MRRERSGYSLVELVVVLIAMGVVLLIAAPRFAALRDGSSVEAAVTETARLFSTARELAILRRTPVAVVIDDLRGLILIRSRGRTFLQRSFASTYGVDLAANRDSVVYDPRGLGFGVSNLSLVVRRGSVVDTVIVSRLGRTRW